jgi:hypothetical protein
MKNKAKQVFEVHPHVNKVWITEDGEFHLHPYCGGEQFDREAIDELEEAADSEKTKEPKTNNTKK